MKANLSIGLHRASDDRVYLEIDCEDSRAQVIRADISLEEFAYLVTGRGVDLKAEIKNLDKVGKIRETQECRYVILRPYPSREEAERIMREEVVAENMHPGYTVDTYMGSQKSITPNPNGEGYVLTYRIHRYVEPEQ